ncbi:MAG: nucleotide sugar dehydrogenase [Geminicoccaceae bacterium]
MRAQSTINNDEQFVDVSALVKRIENCEVQVGVVGLGYVGLPLAGAAVGAGFPVLGVEIDADKVVALNNKTSYIKQIPDAHIAKMVDAGLFEATSDFNRIKDIDILLICVPTPLTKNREPDLSFVERTCEAIAPHLRAGQTVILESTTYPGTTQEVVCPILQSDNGLVLGTELFVAYSPEREDPGNQDHATATIPKVVGADDDNSRALANAFYSKIVSEVVPVSSTAAAEATKLTENIFRAVNIALVNELKVIYEPMGVDVWEVIDAAKSKPFGFMPFYPGPGLGGHCIPIDPFYLTWKARTFDLNTRFIELAGEINSSMPKHVVTRLAEVLDQKIRKPLNGSNILLLGIAYKKNVDDMRESPALTIMEMLQRRQVNVSYHDPYIPTIPETREHAALAGIASVPLSAETLSGFDAVLIVTDHADVNYQLVADSGPLVVDTRNVMRRAGTALDRVFLA